MDEIRHLQTCSNLQVLNMQYNPITWMPFYRCHVLHRLPGAFFKTLGTWTAGYSYACAGLRSLDNCDVAQSERDLAATIVAKEASTLQASALVAVASARAPNRGVH